MAGFPYKKEIDSWSCTKPTQPTIKASKWMMKTNKSYSLTKAQKRVWFNLKLSEKPLPNIAMVFELNGSLDVWALRKALENVVEENTVLKSTIYSSADH